MKVLKYAAFPLVFFFVLGKQVGFDSFKNAYAQTRKILGFD
jgi:hypothetical protein